MAALLALLLLAHADAPAGDGADVERVWDPATLTPSQAISLEGRRAVFFLVLDSCPEEALGLVWFDCAGPLDPCPTVGLPPDTLAWPDGRLVVEGELHVVRHRAWRAPDGTFFPAFTEYRVVADRVR
jgi:hypothetical protein